MTDYEYIYQQAKKFHFSEWGSEELRACQEVLPNLTLEELVKLYRSKQHLSKFPQGEIKDSTNIIGISARLMIQSATMNIFGSGKRRSKIGKRA